MHSGGQAVLALAFQMHIASVSLSLQQELPACSTSRYGGLLGPWDTQARWPPPPMSLPGSAALWLCGGWYLLRVAGWDLLEALACLPEVDVFSAELFLEELLRGRESCWPSWHHG